MKILVAIPWRDNGDRHRQESLDFVVEHLYRATGCPIDLVDGDQEGFSLAAARNAAMRREADVVVVCDADTVVEQEPLAAAIVMAAASDRVILPFTLYRALGPEGRLAVLSGITPRAVPEIGRLDWSVGGVQVARPDVWWALGGQDERFTGWGCEDTAFNLAADRLGRSHVRVPGEIHHLWHPVTWRTTDPSYAANAALLQRYAQEDVMAVAAEWRVSV
jgi:hypothetical protein